MLERAGWAARARLGSSDGEGNLLCEHNPEFCQCVDNKYNIFCSEMSALCHRDSPGVLTDSLCLAVLNAEVVQCFQICHGHQSSLVQNETSQMMLLMLGPK